MIAPFRDTSRNLIWGSKRVSDEFHDAVRRFVDMNPHYIDFVESILRNRATPIFEFHDPNFSSSKIVVHYDEPFLKLLAIRKWDTGEYYDLKSLMRVADEYHIPTASVYPSAEFKDIHTLMSEVREWEDQEGVVIVFSDGQRVKLKSEWYVRRHKAKEFINRPHVMAQIALEVGDVSFDDISPYISSEDRNRYDVHILKLENLITRLSKFIKMMSDKWKEAGPKEYALKEENKAFSNLVFQALRGKDPYLLSLESAKKCCTKELTYSNWIEGVLLLKLDDFKTSS